MKGTIMTATAPPHANGHARPVTLTPLPLPVSGALSTLPQDDPGQSRTAPDKPKRLASALSGFRRNWWRLVFAAVAAVAAVVSYGHIVDLFLSWHAPPLDAHLMPIAIDGLIIIGAGAARSGQVRLGWSAIGPGLAASLYANVMNGLPHGYGPAMGSGWATVALFLATNVMERWKPAPPVTPHEGRTADSGPDNAPDNAAPDSGQSGHLDSDSAASQADRTADKPPSRHRLGVGADDRWGHR